VAFAPAPPLARQEEFAPGTVHVEGQPEHDVRGNPYVNLQQVSDGYFDLLRVPLRAGRAFTAFDTASAEPVAIVSERLAKRLWPGGDPLGRRIRYDPANKSAANVFRTVVGVAGNVQHGRLGGEASFDLYVPYRQWPAANQYLLVRHHLAPAEFVSRAEQVMWRIDPEQSVFDFQPYEQRILSGIWQLRLSRTLLGIFGGVALVLAAVGVYSVASFLAGQRRREIGIRLALGATPARVRLLVLRRSFFWSAAGLAGGLSGAVMLGRILEQALGGTARVDAAALAAAVTLLGLTSLAASGVPAMRASAVDPARTLRQD
jgi:hypothetical protein